MKSPPHSALRKPKSPAQARAAILQASLEEFARRGFEGATVRDIAARTDLSHGMIRYHFETKEKLWLAAVEFLFERINREVSLDDEERLRLESGELDVFRNYLRRYVIYCAKHPEHARFMMQESLTPTPRLAEVVERFVRDGHVATLRTLRGLQKDGLLSATFHPESLLYIIAGACQNMFALAEEARLALDYDVTTDKALEAHISTVIELFCPS